MNREPDILQSAADPDYGAEFPISLYDRPMLAMSNLLLRGDVDAATRAIFTPQTLSPQEMETLRRRFAGPKPGPLVRTILDVATNPLVIAGLVGGYLLWPAAGPETLRRVFTSLQKAVPKSGLLGSWVGAAYTRLRHLPGLQPLLKDVERATAKFVEDWHGPRADAYGGLGAGVGKNGAAGHRLAYKAQGWDQGPGELGHTWGIQGPITPRLQEKMSPAEIAAAARMQNVSGNIWDQVIVEHPEALEELKALAQAQGVSLGTLRKNYFPHMIQANEWQRAVLRNSRSGAFKEPLSRNLIARTGRAIPDPAQLRAGEARNEIRAGFTDELLGRVEADVAAFQVKLDGAVSAALQKPNAAQEVRQAIGQLVKGSPGLRHLTEAASQRILGAQAGLGGGTVAQAVAGSARMLRYPATYSLDFDPVWTRYIARMAPTYAWEIAPAPGGLTYARTIDNKIKAARAAGQLDPGFSGRGFGPTEHYLREQLMPMMQGQRTAPQVARSQRWAEFRLARARWLKEAPAARIIPAEARKFLVKHLEDLGALDAEVVGQGINEYLYLSTMGMNLGPPGKNIWQNPATFINLPGMGLGAWAQGIGETFKRGMAYLSDAPALGARKAFDKHFPDFIAELGPSANIVERLFGAEVHVGLPATGARGMVQKAKDVMMAPFKFSEIWVNRMPAFYGAKARGLAWGMDEDAAARMAGTIVDLCHFTGGPMSMPSGIMDTWAPWRQFLQFPLRFVDFLAGSTRMGKVPGRLDLGTISRTMASSAAIYTVGRDLLHTDLSAGLLFGALPLPQYENSPFYPFPFVPPLVQMAGNVVKGVATGESQPLADLGALLIPGGLAVRRLARTLGPKRADYANRTPDGRIPVYNDAGGLIGAYTPLQLSLRAVGIMPGDAAAERGAAEWLVSQRDQIRGYRKAWLDALMANDAAEQERVQAEFQRRYPELGPLQVKKTDIAAVRTRREMTRVNRILRGFPTAYRPLFENIVGEAQLGAFTQNLPALTPPMAPAG